MTCTRSPNHPATRSARSPAQPASTIADIAAVGVHREDVAVPDLGAHAAHVGDARAGRVPVGHRLRTVGGVREPSRAGHAGATTQMSTCCRDDRPNAMSRCHPGRPRTPWPSASPRTRWRAGSCAARFMPARYPGPFPGSVGRRDAVGRTRVPWCTRRRAIRGRRVVPRVHPARSTPSRSCTPARP